MQDKISIYIIVIVIIFILILIVVLASKGVNNDENVKIIVPYKKISQEKSEEVLDLNFISIPLENNLDSLCFNFSDLSKDVSYIIGGNFNSSTFSIYENNKLIYTNVVNKTKAFALSSNKFILNGLYTQFGTKSGFSNIKFNVIPLKENMEYVIAINNVSTETLKAYRYSLNYEIKSLSFEKIVNTKDIELFGTSEYDIDLFLRKKYSNLSERVYVRKGKEHWTFSKKGKYTLFYLMSPYNLEITGDGIVLTDSTDSYFKILELENPNIFIVNKDENIDSKNLLDIVDKQITLYNQFVSGKNFDLINPVNLLNMIHNKVFIYKINESFDF
jgi:hypothetical protein